MSQREQWHFDGNPDELYGRYLVPATFAPWAADLVELELEAAVPRQRKMLSGLATSISLALFVGLLLSLGFTLVFG